MNLSIAIALLNKGVRPVRVTYDPDVNSRNNPNRLFKTLDPALKKDDYVVVPTHTRHGFTVCKVEEIDFNIDFDASDKWDWIVGKVDNSTYEQLVDQEKIVIQRVGKAEENRKRNELMEAMKLGDVNFTDLDVVRNSILPAPATIRGDAQPEGDTITEAPAS